MKTKILSAGAVLLGISLASTAHAVPSQFTNHCGALKIDNPTNSNLLRDNKSCSTVWVLPPTSGVISISEMQNSETTNLMYCRHVKKLGNSTERIIDAMDRQTIRLEELEPEFEAATKKYEKALLEVSTLQKTEEMQQINALKLEIEDIEDAIAKVYEQRLSCTSGCDMLKREYKELREARKQMRSDLRDMRSKYSDVVRKAERAEQGVKSAEVALNNVSYSVDVILNKLTEYHSTMMGMTREYGQLEGGRVKMQYDLGWEENVQTLTRLYGNKFQFRQVPTKDARIFANFATASDEASYLKGFPSIKYYNVNGRRMLPWGEEKDLEASDLSSIEGNESALPNVINADVTLTLFGACPLYYSNFVEAKSPDDFIVNSSPRKAQSYGISATYQYPAAFKFKVTASYNLYKFYERIQKSGSSGGLFSRKQYREVIENREDKDMFSIDWQVEDPDSQYDDNMRNKVRETLKASLMDRVLVTMAEPIRTTVPNLDTPNIGMPAETGAIVLAKGLQQTCGFNAWCQGGAWLLKGLDAIFGSSKAESTFRSTHNRTAVETWSADTARWNAGAIAFKEPN